MRQALFIVKPMRYEVSLCHRNSGGRVKVPYSGCDGKERARNKFRIFRFLDAHLARRRNAVIVGLCQVFATRTNEMDRKLKAGSYFVLVPKRVLYSWCLKLRSAYIVSCCAHHGPKDGAHGAPLYT